MARASAAAGDAPTALRKASPRKPSRERGHMRYAALLDATEALLQHHSPDDIGLYQIAEHAAVPPASVYHFFQTKDSAFLALAERYLAGFRELALRPVPATALAQPIMTSAGAGTPVATCFSYCSITRLAAATDRPERFMGIHFMNPVPVMELVELIRGIATDESTFSVAKEFASSLRKTIAVSEDFPAFIVNRILLPMINEAIYTLYEGVGGVEAIDTAMKLGARHPMGPLELADFIGLDTCLSVMQVLHDGLADSKYRPCPLLVTYVEAGWLGRKTNRGFYDYRGETPIPTR